MGYNLSVRSTAFIGGVKWQDILKTEVGDYMDYILTDINIELWSKVRAKATLERKTMREVIFEGLKWYVTASEIPSKEEAEKERVRTSRYRGGLVSGNPPSCTLG